MVEVNYFMKRSRTKKVKGLRKIFIIGGYWILLVGLLGIFASPLFRYSANAPSGYTDLGKTIKPSVFVADSGSDKGMSGEYVGIKPDAGKQINGVTGSEGYSNDGDFGLVSKGDSIYITYGGAIVKTLYFYITDKDHNKTGKQVTMSVSPLTSKDKLENFIPPDNKNVYRLLPVILKSDHSGGSVTGFTAANGVSNATGSGSGGSGVGVGVPIPAPGKDDLNNKTAYTYDEYICALYYWALNIGFGLTLLMFIYAGYRYMTAAGNDSAFTETKDVLTSAIMGFLLLLCIRLVLHFLNVPEPGNCFTDVTAGKSGYSTLAINNIPKN